MGHILTYPKTQERFRQDYVAFLLMTTLEVISYIIPCTRWLCTSWVMSGFLGDIGSILEMMWSKCCFVLFFLGSAFLLKLLIESVKPTLQIFVYLLLQPPKAPREMTDKVIQDFGLLIWPLSCSCFLLCLRTRTQDIAPCSEWVEVCDSEWRCVCSSNQLVLIYLFPNSWPFALHFNIKLKKICVWSLFAGNGSVKSAHSF